MVEGLCLQCRATQKVGTLTARKKGERMEEWIWVSTKSVCLSFYMLVPQPGLVQSPEKLEVYRYLFPPKN